MIRDYKFKKYVGKSGHVWLVGICDDPTDEVYVSAAPEENESGYLGPRGYGGRMIHFNMEDGSTISLKGPWHSNPGAFTKDTGVEL